MSRKISTTILVLSLISCLTGFTMAADNTADIDQVSEISNEAYITQANSGTHYAKVYQNTTTWNWATIKQVGINSHADIYQNSSIGRNWADVYQGSNNVAKLQQTASQRNTVDIEQTGGNNWLVKADNCSVINYNKPAQQISGTDNNQLYLTQSGSGNVVGLYQKASGYNYANISQTNGNNMLVAYMTGDNGYNLLNVTQTGSDKLNICQKASNGLNIATVSQ